MAAEAAADAASDAADAVGDALGFDDDSDPIGWLAGD